MAHDVFISYSNKDKAVADAICSRLENEGVRCWYAPRDIAPGADWAASIIDSIEETRILVLVFTDFSNASRQVLREVNNAVRTGAVIVPFRLTNSAPSGGMRYYLSAVHWLDAMNGPLEDSITQLSAVVHSILGGTPAPAPAPSAAGTAAPSAPAPAASVPAAQSAPEPSGPATQSVPPQKPKWLLPVCIAALLVVLAGTAFAIFRPKGNTPESPEAAVSEAADAEAASREDAAAAAPEAAAPAEAAGTEAENTVPSSGTEEVLPDEEPWEDAEDYLYQAYSQYVTLQKYFGDGHAVLRIPAEIEGLPVAMIDEKCFENHAEIRKVILPETISTIGDHAFYGCTGLSEINFPSALRKIDGWAFSETNLTEAILPENVGTLGYGAFYSCLKLERVVVPEKVSYIGENTFRQCPRLISVALLAPDPEIHLDAFTHDSKVTVIGIPGGYAEKYARAVGLNFEAYTG